LAFVLERRQRSNERGEREDGVSFLGVQDCFFLLSFPVKVRLMWLRSMPSGLVEKIGERENRSGTDRWQDGEVQRVEMGVGEELCQLSFPPSIPVLQFLSLSVLFSVLSKVTHYQPFSQGAREWRGIFHYSVHHVGQFRVYAAFGMGN
jgi:hypothetical protein